MAIRALVFDLGGALETDKRTDLYEKWEKRLNLQPGGLRERLLGTGWLMDATYGKFTEEEMLRKLGEIYTMNQSQVGELEPASALSNSYSEQWHSRCSTC